MISAHRPFPREYEPIHHSCEMAKPLNEEMVMILSSMQEDIIVLKSNLDQTKQDLVEIYAPGLQVLFWHSQQKFSSKSKIVTQTLSLERDQDRNLPQPDSQKDRLSRRVPAQP